MAKRTRDDVSILFKGRYISPEEREKIKDAKNKEREYNNYTSDKIIKHIKDQSRKRSTGVGYYDD